MEARRSIASESGHLILTFAALSHPARRSISARLTVGDLAVSELAKPFAMSQPSVSRHLKVLERAGLISCGAGAQRRPRRLDARPLASATAWLESYRQFWEASFDRLDVQPDELIGPDKRNRGGSRVPPRSDMKVNALLEVL